MIFNIWFNFFLDAKTPSGKEKIQKKLFDLLADRYGKASIKLVGEARFTISYKNESREDLLYNIIEFSQTIGLQWIITGNVNFEINLWCNHSKIVGVNSIGIEVDYAIDI